MYVCICHGVSKARIEEAIDAGARSVSAVTRACRAGGDCGSCVCQIREMIDSREEETAPSYLPEPGLAAAP